MIKIFAALALTIGGPAVLVALCWIVSRMGIVKRFWDVKEDDSFFEHVYLGFGILVIFVLAPVTVLFLLVKIFLTVYGLL
mgnify:CR=1 FL=1